MLEKISVTVNDPSYKVS